MAIRISVDDGCASDLRVAELAKKYNIETIFYWPVHWSVLAMANGYTPLTFDEALDIAEEFEIGSHTISHPWLTKIPTEDAKREIAESKDLLENMFGKKITKFCPPRGYTNKELTDFTLKHYSEQRLTRGKGLVHIHPSSGANGRKHWLDCIDEDTTELWGHSHEFDRYDLWGDLETFIRSEQWIR